VDKFWDEWNKFQNKLEEFSRENIWTGKDATEGISYRWHQKHSLPHTKVMGLVACRVTSKTLGIGCAERSWGDTKSLKERKCSNLGSGRLEKQSVCYTSACLEEQRMLRNAGLSDNKGSLADPSYCWEKADEEFKLKLEGRNFSWKEFEEPTSAVREFKCWKEDWEDKNIALHDKLAEWKLLNKYGGIHFFDPDDGITKRIITDNLERKHGKWSLISCPLKEPENEDALEAWFINDMLFEMIADTEQPPELNVRVVKQGKIGICEQLNSQHQASKKGGKPGKKRKKVKKHH